MVNKEKAALLDKLLLHFHVQSGSSVVWSYREDVGIDEVDTTLNEMLLKVIEENEVLGYE